MNWPRVQHLLPLLFMCSWAHADYVYRAELSRLHGHNPNTCLLVNFTGPRAAAAIGCNATLIGPTQLVFTDPGCVNAQNIRRPEIELRCGGDQIRARMNEHSPITEIGGLKLMELPFPLQVEPDRLVQTESEREALIERGECSVITPLESTTLQLNSEERFGIIIEGRTIRSSLRTPIPNRYMDSPLRCLDHQGQSILVGYVTYPDQLVFLDEQPELHERRQYQISPRTEMRVEESYLATCEETGNCLNQLSPTALQLSEDSQQVLQALNQRYLEKLREQSPPEEVLAQRTLQSHLNDLTHDLRDILVACQEIMIHERHRRDGEVENGLGTGAQRLFENLFLGASSLVSNNALLPHFQEVPILAENMSEERMSEIIRRVQEEHPNATHLDHVALAAKEMTGEVIHHFINEMNLGSSQEERDQMVERLTQDFGQCIDQARTSTHITGCADRIAVRAPAELARYELDQQVEENFLSLYTNAQGEVNQVAYDQMKDAVNATFQRCLLNYYYEEGAENETVNRAKACVFEAMLTGYREGSTYQIDQTLIGIVPDPEERRREVERLRLASQNCSYGPLFHSADRLQAHDYHTLSRMEIDQFKRELLSCTDVLTRQTGDRAVRLTLRADSSVREHVPARERQSFEDRVIRDYFDPCMQVQQGRPGAHPQRCEGYITQMVTLDISRSIMGATLNDQVAELNTLPDEQKQAFTTRVSGEVETRIQACQSELHERHQRYLRQEVEAAPAHQDLMNCLNQGIGLIAEEVATLQLRENFEGIADLRPYAEDLLGRPDIQALPNQVRECFVGRLNALESVEQINDGLDAIIQECSLAATRNATAISAQVILEDKLASVLRDPTERQAFIQNYLNGEGGLLERLNGAQTKAELDELIAHITPDVTLRVARQSIPGIVSNYLEGEATPERRQEIQNQLLQGLERCLAEQEQNVDTCVNQTNAEGYQTIAGEIINNTIQEVLADRPELSASLSEQSRNRIATCVGAIDQTQAQEVYTARVNECVADEVYIISRDVPREVLLGLAPLLGDRRSESALRSNLLEIDQVFRQTSRLPTRYARDPLAQAYGGLQTCLAERRSQQGPSPYGGLQASLRCQSNLNMRAGASTSHVVRTSIPCNTSSAATPVELLGSPQNGWVQVRYQNHSGFVSARYLTLPNPRTEAELQALAEQPVGVDLDQVLQTSTLCTTQFEQTLKAEIKTQFVRGPYPGQTAQHGRALNTAGDILLMLQGRADPNQSSTPQETRELMRLVGEQVVTTCRYSQSACEASLRETQARITRYREQNPQATSTQLTEQFLTSPFIDQAIEATVAQTFRDELRRALSDRFDQQGILQGRLDYITSPQMMSRIMNNRYGRAAKEYIRLAIEEGRVDSVQSDPRLRAVLASAVTADLSDGGFVDELMYGLTQPELIRQRDQSFRVGIGALFGVVRRRDFDWHRVRTTPEGQEARRLFAVQLLEPMFMGEELQRMPSSDQRKSLLEQRMENIEGLIEQGIRRLR